MTNQLKGKQISILIGDIVVMYSALYIALVVRNFNFPDTFMLGNHALMFTYNIAVWIIFFYIAGLYNLHLAVNNSRFIELSLKSIISCTVFSIGFFYIYPSTSIAPKTILALYFSIFLILHLIYRYLINQTLKTRAPKTNIAVIGDSKQVRSIASLTKKKPHLGYCIKFILDETVVSTQNKENIVEIINNSKEFEKKLIKDNIKEVIIAQNFNNKENIKQMLFRCLKLNINFISIIEFYESLLGRVELDLINKTWFLENFNRINNSSYNLLKRIFDVLISLIIFIISFPLWIIVAILIKTESTGPIFFIDTRLGKNEKPFTLFKFRTMNIINNNQRPTEAKDPRITKIGKYLRKTRIDELPQVLSVLKGDMSIIGPRPERPKLVSELKKVIPFYNIRMLIKPGITGWDQISGEYHSPSQTDTIKKLEHDFFYIKNMSIYLDISILLKTIRTVLNSTGV